jgi:hypothetical protein
VIERLVPHALTILRVTLAISLITLAFTEKLVAVDLGLAFLREYPDFNIAEANRDRLVHGPAVRLRGGDRGVRVGGGAAVGEAAAGGDPGAVAAVQRGDRASCRRRS